MIALATVATQLSGGGAHIVGELCLHFQHPVGPAKPAEGRRRAARRSHAASGDVVAGNAGSSAAQALSLHPERADAAQQWQQRAAQR